ARAERVGARLRAFEAGEDGIGLERPQPRADALRMRARIRIVSTHERVRSPNVIGVVRGSDPKLRDEYLVYTAHLDHLGITEPVDGDRINNGAFDNATGIASIIEIARAFAALPQRPRRSILFLATTAEEKGLRGADYFVHNPTVPFESIVADVNVDMLLLMHQTRDLIPFGAETNDLGDLAREAAREMGVELSADPTPEEVVFVRSDQYPFVRRGIPAIFVTMGRKAVDPNVDMAEEVRRWRVTRYHSPQDDLSQPIDYSAALKLVELDFRLGLAAANRDARPRWKPGDFFGETFARNR
ncbi:MAG TPA: M20/M25/M40 family metallo-hydrolase, partial [Thermoanaerobaculia bacterium]|nr:M20/M25/M40 family metallo-hydrolase [Thermoanaerobaculia bacterium]